jgi:dihydrofolate reductase
MNIIVAVNSDWGIGFKGKQTVVIPEDREYFREVTSGGIIIVGRKTFESIGKPLPNRKNIVLTNNMDYSAPGISVAHTMAEALKLIPKNSSHSAFVIGGSEVYNQFLPWCTHVYVTKIGTMSKSDRFFPDLDKSPEWDILSIGDINESDGVIYSFDLYKRIIAVNSE